MTTGRAADGTVSGRDDREVALVGGFDDVNIIG
jgi:hypothetical protein